MTTPADHVSRIVDGWGDERPDLDAWPIAVWGRVKLLDGLLEQALAPHFSDGGVSGKEFELLSALRRTGPPYSALPSELARALIVPAATMTKRLDRLEQAGFVTRTPHAEDRRAVVINLTDHGRKVTDQLVESVVEETRRLLAPIAEQRDTLDDLLRRAIRAVGDARPPED
jgi:DNA-binding MarR family transcriptional regulator